MTLHKTYPLASFKTLPSEGEGTFEAVVSIFGNVDLQGDRVMPGAFEKSIAKWQKRGDPVPVLWSHDWGDPFAHIGYVDPKDMKEVRPNQKSGFPGGLYVKGHLDVHKPFAKQVYDLLAERRVTEHSFSYDIPPGGEMRGKDGANELHTVDLIELGPTLKGANPETMTLGTKSAPDAEEARRMKARLDHAADADLLVQLAKAEWSGDAAMRSCHSAADFRKIAFERANDSDPDTAAHWALPHHSSPGADANPAGVAAALAALHGARGGAPDLKNKAAAESHLKAHQGATEKAAIAGKPWHIDERDGKFCVVKDDGNETLKCYDSKPEAEAYLRALYANEKTNFNPADHPRDNRGRFTESPGGGSGAEDFRSELEGRSTENLRTIANAPGALPDVRRIATDIIGGRGELAQGSRNARGSDGTIYEFTPTDVERNEVAGTGANGETLHVGDHVTWSSTGDVVGQVFGRAPATYGEGFVVVGVPGETSFRNLPEDSLRKVGGGKAELSALNAQLEKFDPSQPRDATGEWSAEGGAPSRKPQRGGGDRRHTEDNDAKHPLGEGTLKDLKVALRDAGMPKREIIALAQHMRSQFQEHGQINIPKEADKYLPEKERQKLGQAIRDEAERRGWDRESGQWHPKARGDAHNLINWFNAGADGQIAWGTPGDWAQCVAIASRHMTPEQAHGFCQNRHIEATGMSTAEHAHNEGKRFDPNQPRDINGRWTDTGADPQAQTFASEWSRMTLSEAADDLRSFAEVVEDEDEQDRLNAAADAAENGTAAEREDAGWDMQSLGEAYEGEDDDIANRLFAAADALRRKSRGKAGRMIGASAANTIKEHVMSALDECFKTLNEGGEYSEEKLAERLLGKLEKPRLGLEVETITKKFVDDRIASPDEAREIAGLPPVPEPEPDTSEEDKKSYEQGYGDATAGRRRKADMPTEYDRGYAAGAKDHAEFQRQEIEKFEQQLAALEIKR